MIIEKSLKIKFIQKCKCGAVTIRFTGETSKMSWAALPVEPACMGKVGEGTRRPPMFVGLTEDECRELQEESGSFNDEMLDFINSVFGHEDMINNSITLENIGYHKIGSIFKYNIGSKEVELEVVESSDASCEGCVFNNSKNYYCKDTHCIDVDRKDDIDVIYKEVKRS